MLLALSSLFLVLIVVVAGTVVGLQRPVRPVRRGSRRLAGSRR